MAPLHFTGMAFLLVTLAVGFCFGFVLERAGFGNARNLAAQFYLYDMRVLKVMFTAIVTAMLLIFAAAAVGVLDFGALEVPPTYLGPAIVGGLLLGVGFIIGGYCPGTSLVSMSTLKIDGTIFVLGVVSGLFLFGQTVPAFWGFWNFSGSFGRLTLDELARLDAGWVVLGVVVMAVGAFWFVERVEAYFRRGEPQPPMSAACGLVAAVGGWRRRGDRAGDAGDRPGDGRTQDRLASPGIGPAAEGPASPPGPGGSAGHDAQQPARSDVGRCSPGDGLQPVSLGRCPAGGVGAVGRPLAEAVSRKTPSWSSCRTTSRRRAGLEAAGSPTRERVRAGRWRQPLAGPVSRAHRERSRTGPSRHR